VVAVLAHKVVVLHGGVPRHRNIKVDDLRGLDTVRQPPDEPQNMQDELFLDLLWSDPHEGRGLVASERGDGIVKFGSDTVRDFLRRSGCELLVRSHECPPGAKNATFCASYI
jgi:serine/threonine-protein phosphatase 5